MSLQARARSEEAKEAALTFGSSWTGFTLRKLKRVPTKYWVSFYVCDLLNIPIETFSVSRTKGLPNECSRYVEYHPRVAGGGDCHQ